MKENKEKKIKKIEPNTPYWNKLAFELMYDYIGGLHTCKTCGHPTIPRYCCTFCGEVDP